MKNKFRVSYAYYGLEENAVCRLAQDTENLGFCIPKDIWDDWTAGLEREEEFMIQDSLLYKRLRPDIPAQGRKLRSFSFIIYGEGMAHNVLAPTQSGPFLNRPKTDAERLFADWFIHLCKIKFKATPMWPSK